MRDKEGIIREGKEALGVWREHFAELLNSKINQSNTDTVGTQGTGRTSQGQSG